MARKRRDAKGEALDRVIGVKVYRARQRKGWTIKGLAKRAGVHVNTVQNLENGDPISARTLYLIAGALGIAAGALLPKPQSNVAFSSEASLFD